MSNVNTILQPYPGLYLLATNLLPQFRGLVVDEIDKEDLVHGNKLGKATTPVLMRIVKFPAQSTSQLAILPCRWDNDLRCS